MEIIYEECIVNYGISVPRWITDKEIQFTSFNGSDNEWVYASEDKKRIDMTLIENLEGWQLISHENKDMYGDAYKEVLNVYEEMNEKSSILGYYEVEDISNVRFLRTYDIINDKLVMWFEITLANETKGYSYRTRRKYENDLREYEGSIDMIDSIFLVLADRSLREIEPSRLFVSLHEELVSKGFYLMHFSYEDIGTALIHESTGESVEEFLEGYLHVSPNKTRFLEIPYFYGSSWTGLRIYDIEGKEISLKFDCIFKGWIKDINWIDEMNITFIIVGGNSGEERKEHYSALKLIEGEWIVETTYDIEGNSE